MTGGHGVLFGRFFFFKIFLLGPKFASQISVPGLCRDVLSSVGC
jgi:hypothetical protein